MIRELIRKELREIAAIAAIALVLFLALALAGMGWNVIPGLPRAAPPEGTIPFLSGGFTSNFGFYACVLAMVLGFKQSVGDFLGNAQLFIYHRPIRRQQVIAVKLLVGLTVYLFVSAVPILLYATWAATEGTHASPFAWSMTLTVWTVWLAMTAIYLASFLTGIRPAAWLGTRLAPLAAGAALAFLLSLFPVQVAWPTLIALDMALAAALMYVADQRDFV